MKIVVTGALGHIGSRFIREIPKHFRDAEVVLIDNLMTQRYSALFGLPIEARYHFVEADILKAPLEELFRDASAVVHLAAVTDAANSFNNPEQVEATNLVGTERVATACAAVNVPLIFLSTTSVYGSQAEVVDESCTELKPQSPYAESKLKSELMLREMGRSQGLRFVTLRFGTIFGASAGMRFHTAVNKFIWQACLGQPITVWRTAYDQRRPYLDLGDAVRALCFVIERKVFDQATYNVLTLNATVGEIVDIIRAQVADLRVDYVDTKIMNQLSYTVLCERFQQLGFTFSGSIQQGVFESVGLLFQLRGAVRESFEARFAVEELRRISSPQWSASSDRADAPEAPRSVQRE
ncbi:MAG: SDR family oxidoreductase [Deltaproteobacteria bacterium]|nr:SDR family oxidoreductase [Deltaproteobacteria bacterium]